MIKIENTTKIKLLVTKIIIQFNRITNSTSINSLNQDKIPEFKKNILITKLSLNKIIKTDENVETIRENINNLSTNELIEITSIIIKRGRIINNTLKKISYLFINTREVREYFIAFENLLNKIITETRFQSYFDDESLKLEVQSYKNPDKNNLALLQERTEKIHEEILKLEIKQEKISKENLKIKSSYENKIEEIEDLFNKDILKKNTSINKIIKDIKDIENEVKTSFENKSIEVDKLIGTISDKALSGNYSKYADEEKNEADKMRKISLAFMIISIVLAAASFSESLFHEISNSTFISRIIFAIVLSIPAAYFARESTKHRNQQQHFRKIDLDLKAVGPYSLSLPDKDQHELKKDIASKIFAKDLTTKNEKSYPIDIQELILEIVKSATNEVKKKAEKKNSDTEKSS